MKRLKLPSEIRELVDVISDKTKPVSVFLYGSRARDDFLPTSDYEIGVLYRADSKWHRYQLAELHDLEQVNVYPFVYEDLMDYEIDTPFPRQVYLYELIDSAKTLAGKNVIENLVQVKLGRVDLLEAVNFELGYAMSAVLSWRNGDEKTARAVFTKAVLYGVKILLMVRQGEWVVDYGRAFALVGGLELHDRFAGLVSEAMRVREGGELEPARLFDAITFLNQVVRREVGEWG